MARGFHSSSALSGLEHYFKSSWKWLEPNSYGTAWPIECLKAKGFDDLHALWWTCIREQNALVSQKEESRRFRIMFPHDEQLRTVHATMKNIKSVLWERRTMWLQASYLFRRESARQELIDEGKSEGEIHLEIKAKFPTPLHEIGKSPLRIKSMRQRLDSLQKLSTVKKSTYFTVV